MYKQSGFTFLITAFFPFKKSSNLFLDIFASNAKVTAGSSEEQYLAPILICLVWIFSAWLNFIVAPIPLVFPVYFAILTLILFFPDLFIYILALGFE